MALSNKERCRRWREKHPGKWKEHTRNFRLRHRKKYFCKVCGSEIKKEPNKARHGYCGDKCYKAYRNIYNAGLRFRVQEEFYQWKTDLGCSGCGYRRFGGALDLYHVNPTEKEIRIGAKMWKAATRDPESKAGKELQKCKLLCANCHREEHHKKNGPVT